jgi:signal transduction histidine kinase
MATIVVEARYHGALSNAGSSDRFLALSETFRAFAECTADYTSLVETVAQRLTDLIGDACVVSLATEDGSWLDPSAACARDDEATALLREALAGGAMRDGSGHARRVVRSGEAVLLAAIEPEQLAAMAEPAFALAVRRLGIHSFLSVPLAVRARSLGVLSLFRYHADSAPFDERDQAFARSIADHAALAISNAQLFESLQRELVDRERLESELRQAHKMEALGRMAGGIAHDFNNLLTVILSYCSLLAGRLPSDSRNAQDVTQIERAGQRAAELTKQLLAFSRRQVLEPEPLELGATLRTMAGLLRPLIGEDIELKIIVGDRGVVMVDAGQVEQVVMNLVANARDAMKGGGAITLETARVELAGAAAAKLGLLPGVYTTLAVTDTGAGIDAQAMAHLFEPFFTTKDRGKGTGLGLSTVMGIVEQSGGHVTVDSELGRGSTFHVYLPEATRVPARPAVPRTNTPIFGTERILVVEDEVEVRELIRGVLAEAGFDVIAALDGEHALELADEVRGDIHLLLTDVIMPRLGGRELAARFLARRPTSRVLFMSGYTDDKLGDHGVLDPDVELIQKPLTPHVLLRRVRALLR